MEDKFYTLSKRLLVNILKQPGGHSFFPSPIFWNKTKVDQDKALITFDKVEKNFLYIHIPFCSKICTYCNCFKKILSRVIEIDTYLSYLEQEARLLYQMNGNTKLSIEGIFIGGGTPNLLSIKHFNKLDQIINTYFYKKDFVGFAIDGHPNLYTVDKLSILKNIGVDRVTFAIQTFDNSLLESHNRAIYDISSIKKNIEFAHTLGIQVNIDLMIGLQGQEFGHFLKDVEYIEGLKIDNVSLHYMTTSDNINYELPQNYKTLVSEVKEYIKEQPVICDSPNILESYYASKDGNMVSLGALGVSSFYTHSIFQKPQLETYYKFLDVGIYPIEHGLSIDKKDEMKKYIFLNMLGEGVDIKNFYGRFGESIWEVFIEEWKYLKSEKVVIIRGGKICPLLTDKETLIYMNIFFLKKVRNLELRSYNLYELEVFFLENGDLIDK